MWQDLRYAFRTLMKNPGFTLVAVIAIALAVGPNSAIFSMVNSVLLRPLPFPEPERLVMLFETMKGRGVDMIPVPGPTYVYWKQTTRSFEDLAVVFMLPEYGFNVTYGGEPVRAQAALASPNFFAVLGVGPILGRTFLPEGDRAGGAPAVMISHAFWQRRFGGDPGITGRTIGLDGVLRTVVGVLRPEAESLAKADLWIPIREDLALENQGNHQYGVLARLKPGVRVAQAQAELDGIAKQLEQQYPATNTGVGARVFPLLEMASGRTRPALMMLLGAVAFLLLIACANVASLQLARAATRSKELALRLALGARRGQVIRLMLLESVLLAVCGGLLGLLLAVWSVGGLRGMIPDILPRLQQMSVDGRVLAFTVAVSILTGIIFGLAPALGASRTDLNETLRQGGGRGALRGGSQRARTVLLVGEVALALVLLVGAGLMLRSFLKITAVNPGFRGDNLLTMRVTLPNAKYGDDLRRAHFCRSVVERLETLPGVRSAAAISYLPLRVDFLAMRVSVRGFQVYGQPEALAGQDPTADFRVVTPGYLNTMGIQLRQGRGFTQRDTAEAPRVILVNETLARRYFSKAEAVGQRLRLGGASDPRQIVGVVADVKLYGLDSKVEPAVYIPYEQEPTRTLSLVVRAASDPTSQSAAVRREILAVDPDQPVSDIRSMEEVVSDSLVLRRLSVWMLGIFAALALMLATVGVYGLTAYAVSRRTHEIGLRMALGAAPSSVMRMVLGRGLLIALVGVALGLPGALALARLIQGLLFGVPATDPLVFVGVPVLLALVAAAACFVPARRAIRINPVEALRCE
jgi:putative ABC transport system permease protein